jgi:hypothetical protein
MESFNRRFTVQFYVNHENTYTLENVPFDKVWDESVPGEALRPDPGNRWHVMMKNATRGNLLNLDLNEILKIAYQDYVEGHDNETIVVIRAK